METLTEFQRQAVGRSASWLVCRSVVEISKCNAFLFRRRFVDFYAVYFLCSMETGDQRHLTVHRFCLYPQHRSGLHSSSIENSRKNLRSISKNSGITPFLSSFYQVFIVHIDARLTVFFWPRGLHDASDLATPRRKGLDPSWSSRVTHSYLYADIL